MNFFIMLLDGIAAFIRRNPITCLVAVIIAIACPSLFGAAVWVISVLIILALLSTLLFVWRIRRLQKSVDEQFRRAAEEQGRRYSQADDMHREGDVSLHRTNEAPQKKINDDVGEYVDFEEEKRR